MFKLWKNRCNEEAIEKLKTEKAHRYHYFVTIHRAWNAWSTYTHTMIRKQVLSASDLADKSYLLIDNLSLFPTLPNVCCTKE